MGFFMTIILSIFFIISAIFLLYKLYKYSKNIFYKILLFLGTLPLLINAVYSILQAINGFSLFDLGTCYGIEAFGSCFLMITILFWPIFLISIIIIIVSLVNDPDFSSSIYKSGSFTE